MDISKLPNSTIQSGDKEIILTWIKSSDLTEFTPFYQVYGIVFNPEGEILLIEENGRWKIPGGTPEGNETPLETLSRELIEESDVSYQKALPLGAQRVDFIDNPHPTEGDLYYQLRYVCLIKSLLPQTPDPATGLINPRMFVPATKVTEYVNWGVPGNAMFADAIYLFNQKLSPSL